MLPCIAIVTPAAAQFSPVDLRRYFDGDGISYQSNLADGNFNFNCSYPAEQMPPPGRCVLGGVPFAFPDYADGLNNYVLLRDKAIDLPNAPARTIYLVGSSLFSKYPSAPATLYYVDGSSERHLVTLDGWEPRGCAEVLKTSIFHVQNRIADRDGWPLYVAAIYPQRDAPLDAIVFGDAFTGAKICAMTLSAEAPSDELANRLPPVDIASVDWGVAKVGPNQMTATLITMRDHAVRISAEWSCGEASQGQTIELQWGASRQVRFDCELAPGRNEISLTLTDVTGRKRVVSRTLDLPPAGGRANG